MSYRSLGTFLNPLGCELDKQAINRMFCSECRGPQDFLKKDRALVFPLITTIYLEYKRIAIAYAYWNF